MKKIMPPTLLLVSILAMVVLSWLFPIGLFLSAPMKFIGLIPLVFGLMLSIYGEKQFKEADTNVKPFTEPDVLIMDGLYKYSRNPMYLGFVIILLGVAVLLGSISPLVVVFVFFVIIDRWYIHYEEQAMSRKFGKEYESYKTQIRRWF